MKKIQILAIVLLTATMLTGCFCLHKWEEATCEVRKTCNKCDATEGEPLGHIWADADCENPKTCEECGATEGEALGHTLAEWEATSDSFMCAVCTVCKETVEQKIDREIIGMQNIIGKWTMIAVDDAQLGEGWSTIGNSPDWVELFADGEMQYDFRLYNASGKGTYTLVEYYDEQDSYLFYVDFGDGYIRLRLDPDGELYWISENVWMCFEKD